MSPKLPRITSKDITKVAVKLDFQFDRKSGSHAVYYRKSDKRRIVVPIHSGKIIKPKTLSGIIKDMGLEIDEFQNLL
ncbi:MAG: type II toxin-antitoxin system HicA family toxin [Deltaproteobacteria bacterium]|nr:type II toxin-antitoxin system HicA family toxin [Deltaproteobacteria bacterium]